MIPFLCPNGHELSAREELIGKPGKCPKCGARFLVPDPHGDASDGSNGHDANREHQSALSTSQERISFLCPNGHQLNGPKRLQGKAGQCPHCQARFTIPIYDEEQHDEFAPTPANEGKVIEDEQEDIPVGALIEDESGEAEMLSPLPQTELLDSAPIPKGKDILETFEAFAPDAAASSAQTASFSQSSASESEKHVLTTEAPSVLPASSIGAASVADVLADIWKSRTPDCTLEMHLKEGDLVTASHYAPKLSNREFGVFGVKNKSGGCSAVLIRWDSLKQVRVQGLEKLSEDWLGG